MRKPLFLIGTMSLFLTTGAWASSAPDQDQARQAEARRKFVATCASRNDADACYRAGHMEAQGLGGKRSVNDAIDHLTLACKKEHAQACLELATLHAREELREEGDGSKVSRSEGRYYFGEACMLGNMRACFGLAMMQYGGYGGPILSRSGERNKAKACQAGIQEACGKWDFSDWPDE